MVNIIVPLWACVAVATWCAAAYMVPVVAALVWLRRRRDPTAVIQEDDVDELI